MLPRLLPVPSHKKTALRPWLCGALLLSALGSLSSCRKEPPPQIIICIGDGAGGADCNLPNGTTEYWPPTKLENAWITTQEDMAKFAAWCYGVKTEKAEKILEHMRLSIRGVAASTGTK